MTIIHLEFSDRVFGGFQCYAKTGANVYTKKHLINLGINELKKVLTHNKLESAKILLDNKNFHIHDRTFEQILQSNEVVYICSGWSR